MRITSLSGIGVGILLIGVAASYPRLTQAAIAQKHEGIANEIVKSCRLLEEGQEIQEGYYYAAMLDPSQKWFLKDPKTGKLGKPTREGALLSDKNQSLCDLSGGVARVGPNGVAQNYHRTSPEKIQKAIKERFPDGQAHFSVYAVKSDRFVPNFKQRQEEAEKKAKEAKKQLKIKGGS